MNGNNYIAIKIHDRVGGALFQQDEELIGWINQQPLSNILVGAYGHTPLRLGDLC